MALTERRYGLSKSKLAAFEQCPKRLWLQVHRPEEAKVDDAMQARFDTGHAVGELACEAFPGGIMIEAEPDMNAALALTQELLATNTRRPLFEATFRHEQVLVRVDIMHPAEGRGWHVAEVKSSASAKGYQLSDLATQVWVMEGCGVDIASASIRHIDSSFIYQGAGDYDGLLKDVPADELIAPLLPTRGELAREALVTLAGEEPAREPGSHCTSPFACQFQAYCNRDRVSSKWPISLLPNTGGRLAEAFRERGIVELLDVPQAELRSELHRLIQQVTADGSPYHDCEKAKRATQGWPRPLSFLDFETIAFAIPRWRGTRPYENVPFQFSLHIDEDGVVEHHCFLDLSGEDPRRACAEALLDLLPPHGAIVAYNASFERRCIQQLAEAFPDMREALLKLGMRVVDLLPVARACWYHPEQRGSWSIKQVLPTLVPELSYKLLEIGDGGAAQSAYIEAIAPETSPERKEEIVSALTAYCSLDTEGLRQIFHRLVDPASGQIQAEAAHA